MLILWEEWWESGWDFGDDCFWLKGDVLLVIYLLFLISTVDR